MNTYTENLQDAIVALLQQLELDSNIQQNRLDTAKLKADHTKDAAQNATEILAISAQNYKQQAEIVKQAILTKSLSANVLFSAGELKTCNEKTLTDCSVAAANIQVSANAIFRLASDSGAILNIVVADLYETQFYVLFKLVFDYIQATASAAEKVSQLAMHAAVSAAELAGNDVASCAKTLDHHVGLFLDTARADLTAKQAVFTTDTANRAIAIMDEKQAGGMLETARAAYASAEKAYHFSNRELNFDLQAKHKNDHSFVVQFIPYQAPFHDVKDAVESYAVFLVKANERSIFSLQDAEKLLSESKQHFSIPGNKRKKVSQRIDPEELLDSDGEKIRPGAAYVVFLLTIFSETFRKTTGNFEDLLSAPSRAFVPVFVNVNVSSMQETEHGTGGSQAMIEQLTTEIVARQNALERSQLAVELLKVKHANCEARLISMTDVRKNAQNIENQFEQFVAEAQNLAALSRSCFEKADEANDTVNELSSGMKSLTDKLIYSVEILNQAATVLTRQKALNPLISDELLTLMMQAGTDANNTVALTLAALNSVFMAQSGIQETRQAASVTCKQALKLAAREKNGALKSLLQQETEAARRQYDLKLESENNAAAQLLQATGELGMLQAALDSSRSALDVMQSILQKA